MVMGSQKIDRSEGAHLSRPRSSLALCLLVAVLVSGVASPAEALSSGARMLKIVNRVRVHHDLRPLTRNMDLSSDARHHSRKMAKQRRLFHSTDLASRVSSYNATSWGENVAKAGTLSRVRQLWMGSPDHRRNILDRSFDHAGVGIVRSRGWLWVTFSFYG
jgi:uncharacterized protein YkwD